MSADSLGANSFSAPAAQHGNRVLRLSACENHLGAIRADTPSPLIQSPESPGRPGDSASTHPDLMPLKQSSEGFYQQGRPLDEVGFAAGLTRRQLAAPERAKASDPGRASAPLPPGKHTSRLPCGEGTPVCKPDTRCPAASRAGALYPPPRPLTPSQRAPLCATKASTR